MAVTEQMIKNQCNIKLNNGTGADGTVQTVNVSLGTLSASGWDAQKAMTIAEALGRCFTKTIYDVQHVQTNKLQNSA